MGRVIPQIDRSKNSGSFHQDPITAMLSDGTQPFIDEIFLTGDLLPWSSFEISYHQQWKRGFLQQAI